MLIALLVTLASSNSSLDTDTYLQEGQHTMYIYQLASTERSLTISSQQNTIQRPRARMLIYVYSST